MHVLNDIRKKLKILLAGDLLILESGFPRRYRIEMGSERVGIVGEAVK